MQWHAMAVVLGELAKQPFNSETERAWNVIDAIKWDEPEDRVGRILSQSIKRLLTKAQAHRQTQTSPFHAHVTQHGQPKSSRGASYFVSGGDFDPSLIGHNYHEPTNFMNMDDHNPIPFYMGQHVSPHDMGPQQPIANWYFDSAAIQPLQEQEPIVFNTEDWKRWDEPMHRGLG